jgi:hypothetical protein
MFFKRCFSKTEGSPFCCRSSFFPPRSIVLASFSPSGGNAPSVRASRNKDMKQTIQEARPFAGNGTVCAGSDEKPPDANRFPSQRNGTNTVLSSLWSGKTRCSGSASRSFRNWAFNFGPRKTWKGRGRVGEIRKARDAPFRHFPFAVSFLCLQKEEIPKSLSP